MTLTDTAGPLTAVSELLGANLPPRFTINPSNLGPGGVSVDVATTPRPIYVGALGGPDKASMSVQVSVCDVSREAARYAGDRVRAYLTGVNHRNKPLHPLEQDGFVFDVPSTWGDGGVVTSEGIHTHAETFTLTWQYRPGVTPPS